MPAAQVQTPFTVEDFDSTTVVATYPTTTGTGNTLIAAFADQSVNATTVGVGISACADDSANAFTEDMSVNGDEVSVWRLSNNPDAADVISGTVDSAYQPVIGLFEVSGLDLSSPVASTGTWAILTGGAFQADHTLPFTAAEAGEFVLGIFGTHANRTVVAGTGSTILTAGLSHRHMVWKISTGAGADTLNFSTTDGDTEAYGVVIRYSPAAAAGGSTRSSGLTLLGVG